MSLDPKSQESIKNLIIAVVGLLLFWFIFKQLSIPTVGSGVGGSFGFGLAGGSGLGLFIYKILVLLVGILKVILVLALIMGFVDLIRKVLCDNGTSCNFRQLFSEVTNTTQCQKCNKIVSKTYTYCPHCGENAD